MMPLGEWWLPAETCSRGRRQGIQMSKKLLCIDDELTGLEIRKLLLESQGYVVLIAVRGSEAIDLFQRETVDAVVVDYYMPEMNGSEVARHLKTLRPDIPIILLSAFAADSSQSDFDACVMKGEHPRILLGTLDNLLHSAA